MANISINGVDYEEVPRIDVPNTNGVGNSSFYETSGDTATAADIAYGKTAHGANGLITGEAVTTLQNKTVTPNRYDQQITADSGYDGLGTVNITKDKGVQMQLESSGVSDTPTLLDFSGNVDMSTFIGWSRYFHSTSDDVNAPAHGNSAWGEVKTCKIKLPSTINKIQTRCFSGMTGLVEVDGSEVTENVVVNSRAFFCVPLLQTIGSALWARIKSVTANSFRTINSGISGNLTFEYGNDIVASNLDTITPDSGNDGYCFNRCGFKSFTAPKLPYVSQYMFNGCKHMQTADFTAVTQIVEYGFNGCTSLTNLYLRYNGVVILSNTNAFPTTILSNLKIHVPQGKKSAYEADTNWAYLVSQGATIVEIS